MKPEFAIKHEKDKDGIRLIFVDTDKQMFKGLAWKSLGCWGKQKFENLLVISHSTEKIKVVYE